MRMRMRVRTRTSTATDTRYLGTRSLDRRGLVGGGKEEKGKGEIGFWWLAAGLHAYLAHFGRLTSLDALLLRALTP